MNKLIKEYKVYSANDFNNIPNYCYNVDPEKEPLKQIVDIYNLTFEAQCGLSNCHAWHKAGVIVELENGKLTNAGHICGNKFGEKFASERRAYEDRVQRPKAIKLITEFLQKLPSLKDKIDLIENQAEILHTRKLNFLSQFPVTAKELTRRAASYDSVVNESILRTNSELDDLLSANPYQNKELLRYKEVKKGEVLGLSLFNYNLYENVNLNLLNYIETIKATDIHTEKLSKLIEFEIWIESFEDSILEINKNILSGQIFFSEENYRLLSFLSITKEEAENLSQLNTDKLDEVYRHKTSYINQTTNKKLNREQRRKLQFSSNSSRYNKSA